MVFPGSNGMFGTVDLVNAWWHVLEGGLLLLDEGFNLAGGFIVQFVEAWVVVMDMKVAV